ncbi:MAG: hypothetical protein ABI451_08200 [Dokdonella sp.]
MARRIDNEGMAYASAKYSRTIGACEHAACPRPFVWMSSHENFYFEDQTLEQ